LPLSFPPTFTYDYYYSEKYAKVNILKEIYPNLPQYLPQPKGANKGLKVTKRDKG